MRPRARRFLLAAVALVAYVAFLVAGLPAAWLGAALHRASGGLLALGEPAGTLWHGSGVLGLRSGNGYRRVAALEWRGQPSALLRGRVSLALQATAPDTKLQARLTLSPAGARLQQLQGSLPARMVDGVLPVSLGGELSVQADSLDWRGERLAGSAIVEWRHASLPGLRATRLGDYRLALTADAQRAVVQLATLHGDLRLSAAGEWHAARPQRLELRGRAENAARRSDLEPLMALLGQGKAAPVQPFVLVVPLGGREG